MSIMVTTKKDSVEFNKYLEELKNNPGKKGPNDLEQKIEDLTKELVVEKQLSNILKNKVTITAGDIMQQLQLLVPSAVFLEKQV